MKERKTSSILSTDDSESLLHKRALYRVLFYAGIKSESEGKKIDSYFILNALKVIFARAMILNGAQSAAVMH
jgi:hypothetical protein